MKQEIFFLISSLIMLFGITACWQSAELIELKNSPLPVFYSQGKGHEQQAREVAERTDKFINYTSTLVEYTPKATVHLLSPDDWTQGPYGLPYYADGIIVMAIEDNAFWRSTMPEIDQLSSEQKVEFEALYVNSNGESSLERFFHLLSLHEAGHAFDSQANVNFQRLWLGELYANLALHTYIAEREPQSLRVLELFPSISVIQGANVWQYTALSDFENNYTSMHPGNYAWYQAKLHVASKELYDTGGEEVLVNLWQTFKSEARTLSDDELAMVLNTKVHPDFMSILGFE